MNIDSLRYHIARSLRTCAAVAALLCSAAATAAAIDHSAVLVLGQPGFTTNDTNTGETAYTMDQPRHIAIGGGRVYVADGANNRVLWWNTTSAFSTGRAADGVIGQADLTSNTSGTTAAKFNLPVGVAVDSSGNVWVADYNNNRVLEFAAPSTNGASAIKVFGQPNFTSNTAGTPAAANNLNKPWAMAFDSADNLWVSDTQSNRVVEYNATTISNWASGTASSADKVLGQADFTSSSNNSGEWGLSYPMGLSFNTANDLWVADQNNNRVLRYTAGTLAAWTAGAASSATIALGQANLTDNLPGTAANKLSAPYDVKVDTNSSTVWVADTNNHRVLQYTVFIPGANATLVLGQSLFNTGTSGISSTKLDTPQSVAIDASGNIWVADTQNNRLLQFASTAASGAAATLALGQPVMTSNYPYWITGQMLNGAFAATEGSGRIYVADTLNNRVLWWESSTAYTNGRTADGVIGQPDLYSNRDNRSLAATTGSNTLSNPLGVAVDASNNVWVVDNGNNRILRFAAPVAGVDAVADLVLGQANFTDKARNRGGGTAANSLSVPGSVAIDASGNVWVADEYNSRVVRYPAPIASGMNADLALGQTSLTASTLGTGAATLRGPRSAAVLSDGTVWVTDSGNNRVLKYISPATGGSADLVLGQANYTTATFGATAAELFFPYGVSVSTMGDVWVADEYNHRILRFSSPTVSGQSANMALGQNGFTGSSSNRGGSTAANTLSAPLDVFVMSSGDLLIADYYNNRVLKYLDPGITYTVSGLVKDDASAPLSGVTVAVSGSSADTAVTGAAGTYSFTLQAGGNYTLTPVLSGYSFVPVSQSSIALAGNWTAGDFTGTASASGFAGAPAVLVSGGPNGYAEPTKGYGATIALNPPKRTGHVTVRIFTQRGARLVKKLEADVTAGTTATIAWDCRNTDGELVGSGSYLAVISGAGYDNKKITIGVLK